MGKPLPHPKKTSTVTLESGPLAFCTCGKSSRLPFCDGSYRHTKFTAVLFKIPASRDEWLCPNSSTNKPQHASQLIKKPDEITNCGE